MANGIGLGGLEHGMFLEWMGGKIQCFPLRGGDIRKQKIRYWDLGDDWGKKGKKENWTAGEEEGKEGKGVIVIYTCV